MTFYSLLYVSHSRIAALDAAACVNEIVQTSIIFNRSQAITGALLFTGTHFAQVLEGSEAAVELLMQSISCDSRHDEILILNRGPIAERRFRHWSLAYFGPSRFVRDHVTRLLEAPTAAEQREVGWMLENLLIHFARPD